MRPIMILLVATASLVWISSAGGQSRACFEPSPNNPDKASKIILRVPQVDGTFVDDGLAVYSYDEVGRLTEVVHWSWDGTFWRFSGYSGSRAEYTYDDSGNLIEAAHQSWHDGAWTGNMRLVFAYDETGAQTSMLRGRGDAQNFAVEARADYAYDEHGRCSGSTVVYWNGSSWDLSHRTNYTYDDQGRKLQNLLQHWGSNDWVPYARRDYSYEAGRVGQVVGLQWQDGAWVNETLWDNRYDESGRLRSVQHNEWDSVKGWVEVSYDDLVYAIRGWPHAWQSTVPMLDISVLDAANALAVGLFGTILRTTDGGLTWAKQSSNTLERLNSVSVTDPNTGTVVGDNGIILRTTDGGETWVRQESGTTAVLLGVFLNDSETGTIVGSHGTVLRTTDGGKTWIPQASGLASALFAVHFADVNIGAVIGDGGVILRTMDGGATWEQQNSGTTENLYGVWFTDTTTGTAVGENGIIVRTMDGGLNWQQQVCPISPVARLSDVWFADSSVGVAVGTPREGFGPKGSVILRTQDGGVVWTAQEEDNPDGLRAVDFVDAYAGMAVSWDGAILATTTGGVVTGIDDEKSPDYELPVEVVLRQNYPHPFNLATTIFYELPQSREVTLTVYDILGRQISVLASGTKPADKYEVVFDASRLTLWRLLLPPPGRALRGDEKDGDGEIGERTGRWSQ